MKNTLDNVKFVLKRAPNKLVLLGLSLGLLSLSSFSYIQPKLLGRSIDLITKQNSEEFYKIVALVGVLYIFKYFLSMAVKGCFIKLSQDVNERFRLELLSKAIEAEMKYYDNNEKGYIQSRINEAEIISNLFSPNTLTVIVGGLELFVSAIAMLLLDIRMSVILFLLMPFYFILINKHTRKIAKYSSQTMEKGATVSANIFSVINDIEQIKVIDDKERRLALYSERFNSLKETLVLQGKSTVAYFENTQLLSSIATVLVLAISGYKIFLGQFTIGEYTTYAAYSNRFFSSVLSIASIGITLTPLFVSVERVKEFLSIKEESEGRTSFLKGKIKSIEIEDLSFSYTEDCSNKILKNVSMKLRCQDKIWIQGLNGSGKTTLIKILLGLYPIKSGKILINGLPINDINLKSLRSGYSVMTKLDCFQWENY